MVFLARLYNLYPTLKTVNSLVEIPSDFSNIIRLLKTVKAYALYHHYHEDENCEQVCLFNIHSPCVYQTFFFWECRISGLQERCTI